MRFLFLHPVFPGQLGRAMQALAAEGHEVVHLSAKRSVESLPGVRRIRYPEAKPLPAQLPPYLQKLHGSVSAGMQVVKALEALRNEGFVPDLAVAYGGWGPGMFLKDVYPEKPVLGYFEWFSNARGFEYGFDPLHALTPENEMALRVHNAELLLDLSAFDHGMTPTEWQRSSFPREFRGKISVVHDGIDTEFFAPQAGAAWPGIPAGAEVVTYVSRGLEPLRGFHQFAAAAAKVLAARPRCHVVIAGEREEIFYSRKPPQGKTWRELALENARLDPARVHFTGWLEREQYRTLLRASAAHVYLTVPYVLSWSMLEAMATGCLVVGSRTPPVEEVIRHRDNGLLADYHSPQAIADAVCEALDAGAAIQGMRNRARETVLERHAVERVLPRQLELMRGLSRPSSSPS